jgi:long-subunit acyl-CoA synthetase (AMP-forming)
VTAPTPATGLTAPATRPSTAHDSLCARFQATAARHAEELALTDLDGTTRLTWADYRDRVEQVARGLAAIGVAADDTVAMLVANRPEFHVCDVATFHLGAVPFSVYATSSAAQITELCHNARPRVFLTEPAHLERVRAACAEIADPPVVVVLDAAAVDDPGVMSFDELIAGGDTRLDFTATWQRVRGDDLATLIYTSGTTGPPKGVMITHRNLLAAWDAAVGTVPAVARRGRYVSYLPTAHLADRIFSHYPALCTGSQVTCVDDLTTAVGAWPRIRPTLLAAVPRIWEKLADAVAAGVFGDPDGGLAARLGLDAAELIVSGAAPIRPDILEFFAAAGITICEGYGLSESCAIGTLNHPGTDHVGSVGRALPGVEVTLAADGEVLLRGDVVMAGYRGEPTRTAEAIDAEGWLHTGDIGRLDDGYLSIVDRKKDLIISAGGKNMSPRNIEAAIEAASPLIAHAVAIGDRRPYNVALVVLDADVLALTGQSADDPDVARQIDEAIASANAVLSRVEQIKRHRVVDGPWDPGGDLLTPTLKLRRAAIAAHYSAVIDDLYR